LLYRFGPTDSLNPKWRWITWGSALASLLWLAASSLIKSSFIAAMSGKKTSGDTDENGRRNDRSKKGKR
jgi:uncharacterized BrkB/YihY/UPF0761 family membrane protein